MIAIYLSPLYLLACVWVFWRLLQWLGLLSPFFRKKGIRLVTGLLYLFLCVSPLTAFLLPSGGFWAFAALSGLMGLSAPFFNSVFMALIQTRVEPEYLGRVLGLTGAIMTLASPVGLGLTALFAGAAGLTVWFLLSGVVTLACGGLMLLLPAVRTCSR